MLHDLARKAGGARAGSATRGKGPLIRSLVHRFYHHRYLNLVLADQVVVSISPQQSDRALRKHYGAVFANLAASSALFVSVLLVLISLSAMLFNGWGIEGIIVTILSMVLAAHLQHFCRRYFFARDRFIVSFVSDSTRHPGQVGLIFLLSRSAGGAPGT